MGHRIEPQILFGEAVHNIRKDKGLKNSAVAARGGISTRWLRDVEAGKSNPTLANLRRVAKGLGVGLAKLMEEFERLEGDSRRPDRTLGTGNIGTHRRGR